MLRASRVAKETGNERITRQLFLQRKICVVAQRLEHPKTTPHLVNDGLVCLSVD